MSNTEYTFSADDLRELIRLSNSRHYGGRKIFALTLGKSFFYRVHRSWYEIG